MRSVCRCAIAKSHSEARWLRKARPLFAFVIGHKCARPVIRRNGFEKCGLTLCFDKFSALKCCNFIVFLIIGFLIWTNWWEEWMDGSLFRNTWHFGGCGPNVRITQQTAQSTHTHKWCASHPHTYHTIKLNQVYQMLNCKSFMFVKWIYFLPAEREQLNKNEWQSNKITWF